MKASLATRTLAQSTRAGFTLIEIMLVVAILGILATVVIVNVGGQTEKASIAATRQSIAAIETAVRMYEVQYGGVLPDTLEQLTVETDKAPALLKKNQLNDAWGTPFQYKKISKFKYEIRSAGPDMNMSTEDDITNAVD